MLLAAELLRDFIFPNRPALFYLQVSRSTQDLRVTTAVKICISYMYSLPITVMFASRRLHNRLLQIPMNLGCYENNPVKQFAHHRVPRLFERFRYNIEFLISLAVYSVLCNGYRSDMLTGKVSADVWSSDDMKRTTDSKALNSCSLTCLYRSISLLASARASLSFCTRSV